MDGMGQYEPRAHYVSALSRIQSVDPPNQQEVASLEETEKLKSIRVMDWIRGDLTPGLSLIPSPVALPAPCFAQTTTSFVADDR